ncbi:MAG: alpha/beta fold hydrolase [Saprospiraceae bacterium]|nr:alpha/beta fold hydrolase [Saprospiraceae bacterium]
MPSQKISFENTAGEQLAARLELPVNQHPVAYALFAHCFTCNKNLTAVRNISRALNLNGIAVMRFDFTGLGESEGDFADTNFSSNVGDLVKAAEYLAEAHEAPSMLIGHSLGGAAVIAAAEHLPSIKAVATVGAPFDPGHVSHLFETGIETIEEEGIANVQIGGRPFTVKKQFLEDIREANLKNKLEEFGRALLILHSPQDLTVAIENAAEIYNAARHPKSFVTLDGADHLLTNKADSHYAGEVIATWAKRYLSLEKKEALKPEKTVAVRLGAEDFTTEVMVRHHSLTSDEPASVGGNDFGPSPYELLTASLGTCTAMTLHMYARRKKWDLQEVTVHLDHSKDYAEDAEDTENPKSKIDHFDRIIEVKGDLDETQKNRLLEIADKCPVHRTLHAEVKVKTVLKTD